jgi:hypothetical protein
MLADGSLTPEALCVKDPIVPAASSYVSSHKSNLPEYVTSAQTHQLENMMSTVNVHAISEDFESISGTVVSIVFLLRVRRVYN